MNSAECATQLQEQLLFYDTLNKIAYTRCLLGDVAGVLGGLCTFLFAAHDRYVHQINAMKLEQSRVSCGGTK